MAKEPVFQYTHVEAGLVKNVVLRLTESTELVARQPGFRLDATFLRPGDRR